MVAVLGAMMQLVLTLVRRLLDTTCQPQRRQPAVGSESTLNLGTCNMEKDQRRISTLPAGLSAHHFLPELCLGESLFAARGGGHQRLVDAESRQTGPSAPAGQRTARKAANTSLGAGLGKSLTPPHVLL